MATDAGRVAMVPRGTYNNATTYEVLDVVLYNSQSYVAKQTTIGNLPTDTSNWMPLIVLSKATMSTLGIVKVDGSSITVDADGTIHGHAAAGVNAFNGRDGDVVPQLGDYEADEISFDITAGTLESNDVQGAIEEIIDTIPVGLVNTFATAKTGDGATKSGVAITTPTGVFPPRSKYVVCDGADVNMADYPLLATYFADVYGNTYYFNTNALNPNDGTFKLPDWSADFPENGVLCIKAK